MGPDTGHRHTSKERKMPLTKKQRAACRNQDTKDREKRGQGLPAAVPPTASPAKAPAPAPARPTSLLPRPCTDEHLLQFLAWKGDCEVNGKWSELQRERRRANAS